jgi:acyl-CoA synthetase (AMP-forming)/AMP-acid ligase II
LSQEVPARLSTGAPSDYLNICLREFATSPAFLQGDHATTFQDLQQRTAALTAALIARGLRRGDRLAILVSSGPCILEACLAAVQLGVILVPLNLRLTADDFQFILDDSQPRLLLVSRNLEALATNAVNGLDITVVDEERTTSLADAVCPDGPRVLDTPAPAVAPSDPLLILYTSGTTGRPKGCVLTQRSLQAPTESMRDYRRTAPGDRLLLALPLFHVAGLGLALSQLAAGGCIVFPPRGIGIETLLRLLSTSRVTEAALAPPHLSPLMDLQERESHRLYLQRMVIGGGMYDREFLDRLARTLGRGGALDLFAGYGQTEAGNFIACMNRYEQLEHPRACGKAMAHVEISVRGADGALLPTGEAGELFIRGPSIMLEYWRQPSATAAAVTDGWLRTGDIMSLDSQGFVSFVGRSKELIKTGGENVYPAEVENILRMHSSIADCCVAGIPDQEWGEVVKAFVVLRPNSELDAAGVIGWCKKSLAGYKRPRLVAFVDSIPRDANGKIQRHILIRSNS